MKYKILFVNLFPHIGGAETTLVYLIQNLDKNRFDPYVIVPRQGLFSERLKETRAKIIYLPLSGYFIRTLFIPGLNPKGALQFYNLCKDLKPHLIHLNHITLAFYTGIVRKILGIPVVATSWVNADSIYMYQDLITQVSVNKVLALSPELKKRILRHKIVSEKKVDVVFPGVDTKLFHPTSNKTTAKQKLGLQKDNIVVTIASRFDPSKDHITFLKSVKIVIQKYSKITILIAQDHHLNLENNNSAQSVKKTIDDFLKHNPTLLKNTKFIGYQKNMVPIYQATDILVSSSLYESSGIILIEASSCGLPIVTTNFDTQYHVVNDGKSGFLVPIQNPKVMAEKILLLIKNPRLRTQFGKHARAHIVKHFSIEKYTKTIEAVYMSVMK